MSQQSENIEIRYANLVYMIDGDDNWSVTLNPIHQVWIPCDTQLNPYKMPQNAVYRTIILDELGLSTSDIRMCLTGQNSAIKFTHSKKLFNLTFFWW